MSWQKMKIGDFLKRSKIPIEIEDFDKYKRVTIRGKHQGVSLRDIEEGKKIGTKKQFILKAGQFILSKIDARYGAFGVAPNEVDNAIITGNFWAYDVNNEIVNIEWFNQYTNSPIFYDLCERASSGITHRKYLDEKFFLNYEIDLPSIDEQKFIVEQNNKQRKSINIGISELSHQLELVRQLRQAFLREAMQGKLVPQDDADEPAEILLEKIKAEKEKLIAEKKIKKDKPLPEIKPEEIPFEIPNNWTWCRFQDIAIIESNLVSPFDYPNFPHVAPDNIEKNTGKLLPYKTVLEDEVKSANHYFFPKQLIYSKVRPKLNKVVLVDFEGLCSADMYPLKPLIESKFLQFGMLSEYFLAEVDKFDNRVKMPKINQNQLSQIPIPLPPLAEQKRIVEKLEKLMKYCDELEANIRESKQRAETLLQVALKEALEQKENERTVLM